MDKENEIKPVEIKDLNKTQLILLAMLLSFVTSIATGIVTVTLMQQAPPAVTQTINRVVQHTIEKVVPDYTASKVQTVVVKEDDLVVDAISKTRAGIFPIYADKDSKDSLGDAYSLGGGLFTVSSVTVDPALSYVIKNGDAFITLKELATSPLGFSLLSSDPADKTVKNLPKLSLGKDSDIKSGGTMIMLNNSSVEKGIAESVKEKNTKDADGKIVSSWNTVSLNFPVKIDSVGQVVVNLDGDILGFVVTNSDGNTEIVGPDAVLNLVANPKPIPPTPATSTEKPAADKPNLTL